MRVLFLPYLIVILASLFLIGFSAFTFRSYPTENERGIVASHTKVPS